jgi:Tol biopolymer transport system component
VMIAATVAVACAVALSAVSEKAEATFPGKNGRIAFVSTRDTKTESGDIYTMNPNGTAVHRLTNHPELDFEPAWSPHGRKIAFMSYRHSNGAGSIYRLYTMNARGTRVEPLNSNPHDDHDPAWSPDGSKIAFASYRHSNEDIYTMNQNGTGLERLTHDPKDDDEPAWSPDGKRIAFVRDRHGKKPCRLLFSCNEIYTMNANGTGLERLTNNRVADFNPDWQPLSPPDNWPFKVKGSA